MVNLIKVRSRFTSRIVETAVALLIAVFCIWKCLPKDLPAVPLEALMIEQEQAIAEANRISDESYFVEAIAPDSASDPNTDPRLL